MCKVCCFKAIEDSPTCSPAPKAKHTHNTRVSRKGVESESIHSIKR